MKRARALWNANNAVSESQQQLKVARAEYERAIVREYAEVLTNDAEVLVKETEKDVRYVEIMLNDMLSKLRSQNGF